MKDYILELLADYAAESGEDVELLFHNAMELIRTEAIERERFDGYIKN